MQGIHKNNKTIIIPILSIMIALGISINLGPSSTTKAYADDTTSSTTTDTTTTSTTASVTVSSSCTMTGTINTPHTATVAGGTYTENIGKTTIKTFCNDPNGYALYAIGYTPTTANPTGEYGNTILKGTSTENTISTGVYSSGTTTSLWSMKLNAVSGTYTPTISDGTNDTENFTTYHAVPSTFTKVATYANNTDIEVNGSGTGSSVETTYAAYISGTQPADTYTGQVKYVLVHPNTTVAGLYNIAYDANGGAGTTEGHSNIYNFNEITLANNNFTAPYGFSAFKGWCTTNTSQTTCTDGTLYQPGDKVFSLGTAGSTVTLYAIWDAVTFDDVYAAANKSKTNDHYVMQDLEANMCKGVSEGQTSTLIDTRDNSTYTVAKLNGNCWMTQNLRITGTISSAGSNFSTISSWNVTTADLKGSSYSYTQAQSHIANADDIAASSTVDGGSYTTEQLGAWYNYCAASAGTVCGMTKLDVTEDICPANWHLPTNTENSSLSTALNNNSAAKLAFNPVYGGYYNSGSLNSAAAYGFWWSSTAYDAIIQYFLGYNGGSLDTSGNYKYVGLYIRCMRSGA